MNKETHRIRQDYGVTFVRDMEGDFLDTHALRELIVDLQSTLHKMEVEGLSQLDIRKQVTEEFTQQILSTLNIHYPLVHPFALFDPNNRQTRSLQEPRFCGVYFVQIGSRPEAVKIGQSIDLYSRGKGLFFEYKEPMQLLAFIETDEPQELETAIHRTLRDFQINGEWYELAPAMSWLREKMR